jgi:hypothetical protein
MAVSLLLVLSGMLVALASVVKQSGIIAAQAERIITARNTATYRELNARQ